MQNPIFQSLNIFIKGMIVGIGNIIPGISGATVALILGIYERLINAIHSINTSTATASFGLLKGNTEDFKKELQRTDALFLATLASGALLSIYVSSYIIPELMKNYHAMTYSFFAGLILASIIIPYRLISRKSWKEVLSAVAAIALVVWISSLMSNEEQLRVTLKKLYRTQEFAGQDIQSLLFYFFAGIIAISAMILPGISGSFVLLVLGVYFEVLYAIKRFDIAVISVFSLGCVVGVLGFTKLLHYILDKYYSVTLAFLTGLIVGSLYTLWPFKQKLFYSQMQFNPSAMLLPEVKIRVYWTYGENVAPNLFSSGALLQVFTTFVIGFVLVIAFYVYDQKTKKS